LQCASNLHQLGVALNSYLADHRRYPSAGPITVDPPGGGILYSPFVAMLPYVGQPDLYNSVNFLTGWGSEIPSMAANHTVMAARIQLYLCPADPGSGWRSLGACNYRVNVGARCTPTHQYQVGGFELWAWLSDASAADGLSQTAAISEKAVGDLRTDR